MVPSFGLRDGDNLVMCDMLCGDDIFVRGGPFYGNFEACCALCTRAEGCVAWSATSNAAVALVDGDR